MTPRWRIPIRAYWRGGKSTVASYGLCVRARHAHGSATWQLRVRRCTARLASPLGLSIDGGPPPPGPEPCREVSSVLYAELLPASL